MTKKAATPNYGKNPSKIFFSGTKGPMVLGLGMQHWGYRPNKGRKSDNLGLPITFFYGKIKNFYINFYRKNFKIFLVGN